MASCEAATLSRSRKAAARQKIVVLPRTGLMPMSRPTAMLQASFFGEAPMRRRAKMGSATRR